MKKLKRINFQLTAIILAVLMAVSAVFVYPTGGGEDIIPQTAEIAAAQRTFAAANLLGNTHAAPISFEAALIDQTPRDGYILAPTLFGLSGIDPLSNFILQTPTDAIPQISIDGQPAPTIERGDENSFIITPAMPLSSNSVYIFRIARSNETDITWAFQTSKRFEIVSTLPRNQATNVPVRTGIEIEFSFGDAPDISEFFGIYPHVAGSFTSRGSTAIFVPENPLDFGRVYTVTLQAGIVGPNNEIINANRVFSFETAPDAPQRNVNWTSRLHFSIPNIEFPSFAAPTVHFWLNYNQNRPVVNVEVFRFNDAQSGIDAATLLAGAPTWSSFGFMERYVDTSGLNSVYSTTWNRRQGDDSHWNESYTFTSNLPPGFYVMNAVVAGTTSQMIIQITDLAVQVIADDTRALVWVNDMQTGRPAAGASVFDPISGETSIVSEYGIAVVERMMSAGEYLIVRATDGKEAAVFAHSRAFQHFHRGFSLWDWDIVPVAEPMARSFSWWPTQQEANSQYWTALQLDRTLFQRNDNLNLWGFIQNRSQVEEISHVTAIITERNWWWRGDGGGNDTLIRQNIPVANGAFSGEIRLPHLDPGMYELAIYHGDISISSIFFNVQDYVKPPYQLTLSASQAAIFAGEEVIFTARTEFFEGTPVPDLLLSHRVSGWQLSPQAGTISERTNSEGVITVPVRPNAAGDAQGERSLSFTAEAELPEIGWVHEMASVRVFVNDINVRARTSREGENATISVNVHDITLERLNDGTASSWGDFLGAPRAAQDLSVEILEIYWERVPDGQRYDHILRQTVPRYRHVRRERSLQRFEMTTDAEGFSERNFQVPNRENASYQARVTTTDGNGRRIVHDLFIGRNWESFFRNAEDGRLFLYGANEEGYDIGDMVELAVKSGTDNVTRGNFLFVVVQGGILSYHIGENPLSFTFGEEHVPNAQVFAFHFNGHIYTTGGPMSQRLRYNPVNRRLNIEIVACQEDYRPGGEATITIRATDLLGNPKAANVNISLVDEALFALMDYNVDSLAALYASIGDNLRFSLATHRSFRSDGIENSDITDDVTVSHMAMAAPGEAPAIAMEAESVSRDAGGGDGDTRIRERFEDTAVFISLRTNAQGEASFTFELPDNITSWRITASAISNDLYAGNSLQNLRVTQPMFLHYSLNSVFLAGDAPYIGVNAFGTSLSGGEAVTFEVWREGAPNDIRRASGVAFERVNIPLWEKTSEGFGAIIVRASVAGYSDAVRHAYQVLNSHRQVDIAVFYEVSPDTIFDINPIGMTDITFTDHGRGRFLSDLFGLRNIWRSGARVEGLVARREATILIQRHFPDIRLFGEAGNFDMLEYQTENGGIAILPYASADLATTVMLLPFIKDDVNLATLRNYLWNIASGSATDNRILSIYGLAVLGEPVLLDLQRYAALPELSVRNAAYVALALATLGEIQAARDIFNDRIAPQLERIGPYYRVSGANRAAILDATSAAALLAAKIGAGEAVALHEYSMRNRPATLLMNIERLKFITFEIENHTDIQASITYTLFGESITRELGRGASFNLRIPAQNFHEFSLISVAGEVGAVSIIRTPLENLEQMEDDIVVRREFFRAGSNTPATTFEQGDLVRVQISVDYSARAISGSYIITDFLPAGLVHVANSARFQARGTATDWWAHVTTEGQRITFFDFNSRFNRVHTYFYYARVVNPGIFTAEGTMVQSFGAREYMAVGEGAIITISP
ncbi:MAG: Ig-like domain-containing protein [Clostridiales bacterium]|jgi:hypothetical protein|nr:Ig-like domain-containing protein [Clostridiales bacterium]